jgi:hypothetical protein
MRSLTVLITNFRCAEHTGTETVVRDLALGLKRRGHTPIVYATELGPLADELLERTIAVVDDLAKVAVRPDVIHGQHTFETAAALLHFRGVPAIYMCHDWGWRFDAPPPTPLVRQVFAVDETCRDKLVQREGVPAERVRILGNAVDLTRFPPRRPLPASPGRALLFSNYASEQDVVPAVRSGCERAGLPLDIVGAGVGAPSRAPEQLLGQYDIVFAKARCALEAMATGAAVVLCDFFGFGGMVNTRNVDALRRLNFGRRALVDTPVTAERVADAVTQYCAADAALVSERIRTVASLDGLLDELIPVYQQIAASAAGVGDFDSLFTLVGRLVAQSVPFRRAARRVAAELAAQTAAVSAHAAHRQSMEQELIRLRNAVAQFEIVKSELAELRSSRMFQLRERFARIPMFGDLLRGAQALVSKAPAC